MASVGTIASAAIMVEVVRLRGRFSVTASLCMAALWLPLVPKPYLLGLLPVQSKTMEFSAQIELRILGPTELHVVGDGVLAPKRLALLAYLALGTSGGYRRRDHIVGIFWPDLAQDAARAQLRKTLFALRETLGPDAIVSRGDTEVRLDPAVVWCDAAALSEHVARGEWREALNLYRGELLEGLFPGGVGQEFDQWLLDVRMRMRQQAAQAAWECSSAEEERGDGKAAAVMARRALDLTPDDEAGVRRLIDLLDRHGDRAGALRVYVDWQTRLQSEYGVEPAPETRKLARRVQAARRGESHETPPTSVAVASPLPAADSSTVHARRSAKQGALSMTRAWIAAAIVLVGAIGFTAGTLGRRAAPARSVAVLPLRPIGDSSIRVMAAGVSEQLTTALASDPSLVVRTTERTNDSAEELVKRLGVSFVMDGGVQRARNQLRFTFRLLDGRGVAVWAGSFTVNSDAAPDSALRIARDVARVVATR